MSSTHDTHTAPTRLRGLYAPLLSLFHYLAQRLRPFELPSTPSWSITSTSCTATWAHHRSDKSYDPPPSPASWVTFGLKRVSSSTWRRRRARTIFVPADTRLWALYVHILWSQLIPRNVTSASCTATSAHCQRRVDIDAVVPEACKTRPINYATRPPTPAYCITRGPEAVPVIHSMAVDVDHAR
ncbi:hypothetical protein B0H16DRAFT_1724147 [Mycena metata]|uniref:Uncharacterized protein n=1 Tax=Mycena metata TaxID=1033252 RepID=A0AAD7IVT8_9AGAR|nr:hypothetical protein B0H16DRAFT_1724147 [Mycena metata]